MAPCGLKLAWDGGIRSGQAMVHKEDLAEWPDSMCGFILH
jgi:hypothetical protein